MCSCKIKCCCSQTFENSFTRSRFIPFNNLFFISKNDGYCPPGPMGLQGPPGPQGPIGVTGPQGNSGITTFLIAESENITTTTSSSDVLMNNMIIIPPIGIYAVWFSGELDNSQGNSTMITSIYSGSISVLSSQRTNLHNSDIGSFSCMALVNVNGVQAIEGRWRTDKGTAINFHRSLLIIQMQ